MATAQMNWDLILFGESEESRRQRRAEDEEAWRNRDADQRRGSLERRRKKFEMVREPSAEEQAEIAELTKDKEALRALSAFKAWWRSHGETWNGMSDRESLATLAAEMAGLEWGDTTASEVNRVAHEVASALSTSKLWEFMGSMGGRDEYEECMMVAWVWRRYADKGQEMHGEVVLGKRWWVNSHREWIRQYRRELGPITGDAGTVGKWTGTTMIERHTEMNEDTSSRGEYDREEMIMRGVRQAQQQRAAWLLAVKMNSLMTQEVTQQEETQARVDSKEERETRKGSNRRKKVRQKATKQGAMTAVKMKKDEVRRIRKQKLEKQMATISGSYNSTDTNNNEINTGKVGARASSHKAILETQQHGEMATGTPGASGAKRSKTTLAMMVVVLRVMLGRGSEEKGDEKQDGSWRGMVTVHRERGRSLGMWRAMSRGSYEMRCGKIEEVALRMKMPD